MGSPHQDSDTPPPSEKKWHGPEREGPFFPWQDHFFDAIVPNLLTSMTLEELAETTDVPESDKEHLDPAYMFCWRKLLADEEFVKRHPLPTIFSSMPTSLQKGASLTPSRAITKTHWCMSIASRMVETLG